MDIIIDNRVDYIKNKYNVVNSFEDISESLIDEDFKINNIRDNILYTYKLNDKGDIFKHKVYILNELFEKIVSIDPSNNKIYVQWIINTINRILKNNNENLSDRIELVIRFAFEDLLQAHDYLILFDLNKKKKKFIDLVKSRPHLSFIQDPSDINQYKNLSQLFDAVDPFIERDSSSMKSLIDVYVSAGKADIPTYDRNYTVYIPKTLDASVIFHKFANWCTARPNNSNYSGYINHKTPFKNNSKIYIIIDNKFFYGESDYLVQIHIETNQIKDRSNGPNIKINHILENSEALSHYFYNELIVNAKEIRNTNNIYLNYLIEFGFSEALFEFYKNDIPVITLINQKINKLPNLNKFKNLTELTLINCGLKEINESVYKLEDLYLLCLRQNKLKRLPNGISNLKNLVFINFMENELEDVPEDIKLLDPENGGSLYMIKIEQTSNIYNKLKTLLPNVII